MALTRWTFTNVSSPVAGSNGSPYGSAAFTSTSGASGLTINSANQTISLNGVTKPTFSSGWRVQMKFSGGSSSTGTSRKYLSGSTNANSPVIISRDSGSSSVKITHTDGFGATTYTSISGYFLDDASMHEYDIEYLPESQTIACKRDGSTVQTLTGITKVPSIAVDTVYLIGDASGLGGDTVDPLTLEYYELAPFTVVNKTVKYSGGDYTTIQSALAAIPSDIRQTNEQWNVLIDESSAGNYQWTITSDLNIPGANSDATRYVRVAAAPGKSFRDNPNKLTNALRYDANNGIALLATSVGSYSALMAFGGPYIRIEGLQMSIPAKNYPRYSPVIGGSSASLTNCTIKDCIIDTAADSETAGTLIAAWTSSKLINTLIITNGVKATSIPLGGKIENCTIISRSPANTRLSPISNNFDPGEVNNTLVLGYPGIIGGRRGGITKPGTASNRNATNIANTVYGGTLGYPTVILRNGSKLLAAGRSHTATSTDGINWTYNSGLESTAFGYFYGGRNIIGGIWANNTFFLLGDYNNLATSFDGVSWTSQDIYSAANGSNSLNDIAYNGTDKFVIAVSSAGTVATSTTGYSWSSQASNIQATGWGAVNSSGRAVVWTGTVFVLGGQAGRIATSPDGITWTYQSALANLSGWGSVDVNKFVWIGPQLFVFGNGGKVAYSTDLGASWTYVSSLSSTTWGSTNIISALWNGSKFLIGGDDGRIATSPDGITWTYQDGLRTVGWPRGGYELTSGNVLSIAWDGSQFVVVGGSEGLCARSADGVTWSMSFGISTIPTSNTLSGLGVNTLFGLNASNQIQSNTSPIDARTKTGSNLIGAGARSQAFTLDLDIVGSSRSISTPTIGVWEFATVVAPTPNTSVLIFESLSRGIGRGFWRGVA